MNKRFYQSFFKNKGTVLSDKGIAKLWLDSGYPINLFIKDFKFSDDVLQYVLARQAIILHKN